VLQLHSLVLWDQQQQELPNRSTLCKFLEAADDPVQYLQISLQALTPRISQILEMVVAPVLPALLSCPAMVSSQVFTPCSGNPLHDHLGLAGLSLPETFRYLRHLEELKMWAFFGYLICPGVATL
jgi:hypothetical protein